MKAGPRSHHEEVCVGSWPLVLATQCPGKALITGNSSWHSKGLCDSVLSGPVQISLSMEKSSGTAPNTDGCLCILSRKIWVCGKVGSKQVAVGKRVRSGFSSCPAVPSLFTPLPWGPSAGLPPWSACPLSHTHCRPLPEPHVLITHLGCVSLPACSALCLSDGLC